MDATPRPLRFAVRHRLALGIGAIVVLAVVTAAVFDWNWLRGPVQRVVAARTGMSLTLGDLDVDILRGLHTVARDVHLNVQGNEGAALLEAREIEMGLVPTQLLRGRVAFRYLAMTDAQVTLTRDAEGKTNWSREQPKVEPAVPDTPERLQLAMPFDVDVLALKNVEIRYDDVPRNFELRMRVSTDNGAAPARRTRLEFGGRFGTDKFAGTALAGALLTLQNTGQPFPIELQLTAGRTKVAALGWVSDLLGDVAVDGSLSIAGPSLGSLYPTLPVALPSTPPYAVEGHLQAKHGQYQFTQIRGTIGRSDVSGDAQFRMQTPRPFLDAKLHSQHLALVDLGVVVGVGDPNAPARAPSRVLPDARFDVPRLNAIDAAVTLTAQQVVTSPALTLEDFSANVKLTSGVLRMEPLKFGFSGGDIVSTVVLDGRRLPLRADAAIDFRRIQFGQMFPTLDRLHLSSGAMGAQMHLVGHGQSVAELLGSSDGTIGAAMSGGQISQTVVAAASLDGGRLLPLLVRGDKPVPVRCAAVLMEVKHGIARSTLMLLDTANARIDGGAAIDLSAERFELELRSKPKSPSILSLHGPIFALGTFRDPHLAVGQGALLRGGAAAALAAVNPFAALLPLIEAGRGEDTDCQRALRPVAGALDQTDESGILPPPPPAPERTKH